MLLVVVSSSVAEADEAKTLSFSAAVNFSDGWCDVVSFWVRGLVCSSRFCGTEGRRSRLLRTVLFSYCPQHTMGDYLRDKPSGTAVCWKLEPIQTSSCDCHSQLIPEQKKDHATALHSVSTT